MDLSQYRDLFLVEAKEHLDSLNECLLNLERNPANQEIIDDIFRSAHTLKGMAATMNYDQITELSHEMENALLLLKEGKIQITPEAIDVFLKCLDFLEIMVQGIRENKESGCPIQDVTAKLQQIAAQHQEKPVEESTTEGTGLTFNEYDFGVIEAAEKSGYKAFYLKVGLSSGTVMKSARAFMVFHNLEDMGQVIKCCPDVQDIEEERFDDSFEIVFLTQFSLQEIEAALKKISEIRIIKFNEIKKNKPDQSQTILDNDQKKVSVNEPEKPSLFSRALKTVRVDIERLDNLMNLVGELVINKTRLEQIGVNYRNNDLLESVEQMGRLTTDLQNLVMKVRMVPVEQVFNRFPRMVRDLAKELNKEVDFVVEGKETELDRTVIDEIGDPLVHLLRNALDHGLETPGERLAKGKTERGFLYLRARQEGDNVYIEIEDDGRGIDLEKIREKAIAQKLTLETGQADLDEKNLLNLIFQPGFSTAEQVTDVSGRGVGMDVVKTKIEALNGTIEITTKKDQGTKVKIILPLTLAIIQALLVNVGREHYAIPLSSVDETTCISVKQIKTIQNKKAMFLRGEVLPLVSLHDVLEIGDSSPSEELYVVVARKGEQKIGLVVDLLAGQKEIVIKSLGKILEGIPGIAGATILGNGQVSLILDVNSLF